VKNAQKYTVLTLEEVMLGDCKVMEAPSFKKVSESIKKVEEIANPIKDEPFSID
jgi:hypothetical protein